MMKAQDVQTISSITYELVEDFFKQELYKETIRIEPYGTWIGSYSKLRIYVPLAEDDDCFIGSGSIGNVGLLYVHNEIQIAKLRGIADDIRSRDK